MSIGARPYPGEELVRRVAPGPEREPFFAGGRRSVEETSRVLGVVGGTFSDYRRILDFGCGCGRMLTWLEDVAAAGSRLYGTDIDADAVAWVNAHLPFAEAETNGDMPPLSYPDGFFGLVDNHSVFSHLDESRQDAWLEELQRVTGPGGHLVLTVHGEHAFAHALREEARVEAEHGTSRLDLLQKMHETKGLVFLTDEASQRFFPAWYGVTFHAPWYVFRHWSRWFTVRTYVPQGALGYQDMILLEPRSRA